MSAPVWSEEFETLLPELLQTAYEHADVDDDLERIWLIGLRREDGVEAAVAYRLRGQVLGADEVVHHVVASGDPARLAEEHRAAWRRLFDQMADDGEAATQVRVRYDVEDADAAAEFDYDPVDAGTVSRWRATLR